MLVPVAQDGTKGDFCNKQIIITKQNTVYTGEQSTSKCANCSASFRMFFYAHKQGNFCALL